MAFITKNIKLFIFLGFIALALAVLLRNKSEKLDSKLSRYDRDLRSEQSIDRHATVEKVKDAYIRNYKADAVEDTLLLEAQVDLKDTSSVANLPNWQAMDEKEKIAYLIAKKAKENCYSIYAESRYLALAEKYASICLKHLIIYHDKKLELDILQCIATINYMQKSNYKIAEFLFKYGIMNANKVDHPLRQAGLMYNLANLYVQSHRYSEAKQLADQTIEFINEHMSIEWMDDYLVKCHSIIATILMKTERYEESVALCESMIQQAQKGMLKIDFDTKTNLKLIKGLNHKELAHFDDAKAIFFEILEKDTTISSKHEAFASLSHLYYDFSIYGMAYLYADSALHIVTSHTPEKKDVRCTYLIYCAQSSVKKKDSDNAESLIAAADKLAGSVELPHLQAELYNSLGDYYQEFNKYEAAIKKYQLANRISSKVGLREFGTTIQLEIAKCHIKLGQWQSAEKILEQIVNDCNGVLTRPCEQEAQALLASVYFESGETDAAIKAANKLIQQIKILGSELNDLNNRVNFRHSVYKHLKKAAYYEIHNARHDSAFAKLDFAKSVLVRTAQSKSHNTISLDVIKNNLSPTEALLSYMLDENGCFLFFVNCDTLLLFPLSVDRDFVAELCSDYRRNITTTGINYAQDGSLAYDGNFKAIKQQGFLIWQKLFKEVQESGFFDGIDMIYIVPDDALYGIPFSSAIIDTTFLIEDVSIVRIPAASALSGLKKRKAHRKNCRVLYAIERSFSGGERLAAFFRESFGASEELSVQSSQWQKSQILSKLENNYDIIFLYGHSEPNPVNPEQSIFNISIFLENEKKYITYAFTMAELNKVDWRNTETVILFGCQTGIGIEIDGIGYLGFQQSIMALGAPQVVATLWEIDSQFAHFHAMELLKKWRSGQSIVKALQIVQKNEIKNLSKKSYYQMPHPYFWAAYTVMQTGV